MGSDALEKSLMMSAKSTPELLTRLKNLVKERDKRQEIERQHEQQLQQQQIEAREREIKLQMENENMNKEKDRQSDLVEAQVKALGYANDTADQISKEILELRSANLEQEALYQQYDLNQKSHALEMQRVIQDQKSKQDNLDLQERIKLKEIKLREAELIETAKRNAIENKKVNQISKSTK
jgi:hypothetical protein